MHYHHLFLCLLKPYIYLASLPLPLSSPLSSYLKTHKLQNHFVKLGEMAMSSENEQPMKAFGWAAKDSSGHLSPFKFSRRHEIVGVITEVGTKVTKFKVGDKVGVGCMVGSCCSCANFKDNLENILSYGAKYYDGTTTYGGYSNIMVSDEHFVIKIPNNLPLDGGAPLLCAGITVYSPLKYHGFNKGGMHLGIVGLGGLGHMAIKIAKAMGLKVTIISISPHKKKEAVEHLGADGFLVSQNT